MKGVGFIPTACRQANSMCTKRTGLFPSTGLMSPRIDQTEYGALPLEKQSQHEANSLPPNPHTSHRLDLERPVSGDCLLKRHLQNLPVLDHLPTCPIFLLCQGSQTNCEPSQLRSETCTLGGHRRSSTPALSQSRLLGSDLESRETSRE
jgi:hypothetical protein